jgi:arylsulfatase A-like enzyme
MGCADVERRPNVLVLFPDQLRRQALSINGDPNVKTPNIDRLAKQGANFQRAYATNPVCSPAKATMQTGRYPHQTGVVTNEVYLPQSDDSLANSFARAGYATGFIGKWHLDGAAKPGFVPAERRQGYTFFAGFNRGHWYSNRRKGRRGGRYYDDKGALQFPGKFETVYQTDLALEYMANQRDRPFLLFVSYGAPHSPYSPPKEFRRVRPEQLVWRENVPVRQRNKRERAEDLCGYYGLIELLDHEIGLLLDFLETSGMAENTIVFLSSDHGDSHGSHGLATKGQSEEELSGIPLIVAGPGVKAGLVSQTLASQVDFAPTLLSLAGVKPPDSMVGRDLSSALRGEVLDVPSVYLEGRLDFTVQSPETPGARGLAAPWRAIVTPTHKLTLDVHGQVRLLVDLEEDPFERDNLAGKATHQAIEQQLIAQLHELARAAEDPFPVWGQRN